MSKALTDFLKIIMSTAETKLDQIASVLEARANEDVNTTDTLRGKLELVGILLVAST
jgi:hypothetical protein